MIISMYTKKAFDKIQHVFILFKLNEIIIEGYFINMMKYIYEYIYIIYIYLCVYIYVYPPKYTSCLMGKH